MLTFDKTYSWSAKHRAGFRANVNQPVSSVPIRTPKIKQYWTRPLLGGSGILNEPWMDSGWLCAVLVNVCHHQVLDFVNMSYFLFIYSKGYSKVFWVDFQMKQINNFFVYLCDFWNSRLPETLELYYI